MSGRILQTVFVDQSTRKHFWFYSRKSSELLPHLKKLKIWACLKKRLVSLASRPRSREAAQPKLILASCLRLKLVFIDKKRVILMFTMLLLTKNKHVILNYVVFYHKCQASVVDNHRHEAEINFVRVALRLRGLETSPKNIAVCK